MQPAITNVNLMLLYQNNCNNVLDFLLYTVQCMMRDCKWQFYRGCKHYLSYWKDQLGETETSKNEIYSCCCCKIGPLRHFKAPGGPHESSGWQSGNAPSGRVEQEDTLVGKTSEPVHLMSRKVFSRTDHGVYKNID